jgi:hypothetical protein
MPVTRIIVNTGNPFFTPDGELYANKPVTFQLVKADTLRPISLVDAVSGEFVVSKLVETTTTSGGLLPADFDLWPNTRGTEATYYQVSLPEAGTKPFSIRVTSGEGNMLLLDAISGVLPTPPAQTLTAFEALLATLETVATSITNVATTTINGLMSFVDKVRLDALWSDVVVVRTSDGLATAISAAGANKKNIKYTVDQTLSADLIAPDNIELIPINGAVINHGAYTISYAGSTARWSLSQVFNGTGAVTGLAMARPEWFTTNATQGTTDMAAAIQTAANASRSVKGVRGSVYAITTGVNIPAGTEIDFNGATLKRKAGSLNGGPTTFMLKAASVSGVGIKNVVIDGNKAADGLSAATESHRFGGLVFDSCTDCDAENVTVTGTVNAEDTAGIYVVDSSRVHLRRTKGYGNDRSAVYFKNSPDCTLTADVELWSNLGSGVTSYNSDRCHYAGITAHDNGYSQVSVNGLDCVADNIIAYNGAVGYAGINFGHDAADNRADYSQGSNLVAYNNAGWGVTVVGSTGVSLNNVSSYGNTVQNIRVFSNSTKTKLNNIRSFNSTTSHGLSLESGTGHMVSNTETHGNAIHGIIVNTGVDSCQFSNIKTYNNGAVTSAGSGGLVLNASAGTMFSNIEAYDDQTPKTQESGLWVAGGSGHIINNVYTHDNLTHQYRETSSPTGMGYKQLKIGSDPMQGAFTATAGTVTTITNNNARAAGRIKVWPTSAAAVAKGLPYVSSLSVGVSFTLTFPSAMAGTETYAYEIE